LIGPDPSLAAQLPLFMAAVLVLNATPGVDLLLTVTRSAQSGVRAGAMAALGITVGCVLHVLAAAFGLAALLAWSAAAFTVLKWAGAAYLAWLGLQLLWTAWRGQAPAPAEAAEAAKHNGRADFRRGLMSNLLNPKVALFMLAFLPQFVPAATTHKTQTMLGLGLLLAVQSLLFLLAVAWLTVRLSRLRIWAGSTRWLQAASGVVFLGLAARLAGSRLDSHG
jgi:threonine/homoserine/homoserine lactone efflux protein